MHADAYAGYNNLYISEENPGGAITEVACWAYTRRKFYEVTIANDKANIAISVLEEISRIYQIEGEIKDSVLATRSSAHHILIVPSFFI